MDVISFSEAATANGRIEKINANPDSSSGIVTVPKTIAIGETVTIPAGRVAILPNVQVDGVLNVDGEVFIPSGATLGDLDAQLALKAPLSSPAFTGTPTAPTQSAQDNSTKLATTAYVDGKMVRAIAVNSTSGTSIDFTGIPNWVKKITVMFAGVSTNGSSQVQIQLGSTTIQTTGYLGTAMSNYTGVATANHSSGFLTSPLADLGAMATRQGLMTLVLLGNNIWCGMSMIGLSNTSLNGQSSGSVTLSGVLDRIRITTLNGTDTFDAGQINILYEG